MPTVIIDSTTDGARPRIAWDNLLQDEDATITTDSEAADYEHENAYDWLPHTHWMPASDGTHYITAVWGVAQSVNYFAFYSHDLDVNAGTLTLQYSLDAGMTWSDAATSSPISGAPVYIQFATINAAQWRVKMVSTPASKVGVVAFGVDMELERGVWIGFTPPDLGRDTDITTIISENGGFLGRSVIRNLWASKLDLDFLSFDWVYDSWLPFVKHAEVKPFFFTWNPTDYPSTIAFCFVSKKGDIEKPTIAKKTMMSTGIKFMCNLE